MQSTFTDCPHREKLAWLADMIQSMGSIHAQFDVAGYLRHAAPHARVAASGRARPGHGAGVPELRRRLPRRRQWGGAFIITPYTLWQTYGDTRTMREY